MTGEGTIDKSVVEAVAGQANRNLGVKVGQQIDTATQATKANNIFQYCLMGRKPYELDWFINDTFHRDRQVLRYNVNSQALEPMPAEKAVSRININKSKQLVRGVTSFLTREHPMTNVIAGTQEDDAYSKAKKEQYLLEHWYDHLQMNAVHKKVAGQAARHGIAWSKTLWDGDAVAPTNPYSVNGKTEGNVRGEVLTMACDNYSIYADWRATSKADMRFINEAFPRTLGELSANAKYDQNAVDMISADDKSSLSTLKLESLTGGGGRIPEMANHADPMQRTVIIRETYVKEYDLETMEWCINLYVTTEANVLLYSDRWPINEFPYEYYQTDIADVLYETDGVIKDIRGLQQALSRAASQIEETMQTMGKINWLIPRGSGITVITDRTGQFVQYNPAAGMPTQSHLANLPQYTETHMHNLERWIDDIGGIHDATYGKLPTSRASGDLVTALQSGDSTSLGIYKDNFADYIAREAKLQLKTAKYHYATTGDRKVPIQSTSTGTGQYSWATITADDIVLEDKVRVQVGSGLPYDQNERIKLATELKKEGIVNETQALKLMNVRALTDAMGDNQQDIDRQIEENRLMMAGQEIDDPYIFENHDVHIEVIDQLGKSDLWWKLKDAVKQNIMDHRSKHMKVSITMKKLMASLNVEPIKRSESLMVRSSTTNDMSPIEKQQFYEKFGIDSDAAEIMLRGGLNIEKPEDAVNQSGRENDMMAQGFPSKVSLGDNHMVHMEMHNAYQQRPDFVLLPKSTQKVFQEHESAHLIALKATTPQPGLMPNSNTGNDVPSVQVNTAGMKKAKAKSPQDAQKATQAQADIAKV